MFNEFFNFFSYQRFINAVNILLIASGSLNLRKNCPKLLKKSMEFFLIFSISSIING